MRKPAFPGGWLLVGFIVVLVFVFIVLAGIIFFVTQHRKTLSHHLNQTKSIYLAQTGVMSAVYGFRWDDDGGRGFKLGTFSAASWEGSWPDPAGAPDLSVLPDEDVFILNGEQADFLLVNMLNPEWTLNRDRRCGRNLDRLRRWSIRNVLLKDSAPEGLLLQIEGMRVSWEPDGGERVVRVDLKGRRRWRDCTGAESGDDIVLNKLLKVGKKAAWTGNNANRIWFDSSGVMPGKNEVIITFVMTDGSEREATYDLIDSTNSSASFTVKSTGRVRQGSFPFQAWRRLQAEYRMSDPLLTEEPGNIIAYTELKPENP